MAEAPKDPVETQGLEVLRKAAEEDPNLTSKYRIRTTSTGTFTPSGLSIAGKLTFVELSDSAWTALPLTPLSNRNGMSIQNQSPSEMQVNFTGTGGYTENGIKIIAGGERYYDITDSIVIYGRLASGTAKVAVEELS